MNTKETSYVISNLVTLLHDAPQNGAGKKTQVLELYFNDLYKMFLAKLSRFEAAPSVTEADKMKLKSLLDEFINVKSLLAD